MASISYKLSTKLNHQGESQIYLDVQSDRKTHYRLKSGVFVSPETFNRLVKADRVLSLDYLFKLDDLLSKSLPCSKEEAEKILQSVKGDSDDILTLYDTFCRERVTEKGLTKGTQQLYHCVRVVLESFTSPVQSVKTIGNGYLGEFISQMNKMELTNKTQLNYWRAFKVFLKKLVEDEILDQKILLYKPHFKQSVNDVVYLTHNELYRLFMLDLDSRESVYRDVFCVQCFTGMRYSDMVNLKKENIKEDVNGKYITILTKKTTQRLKIYLNTSACEILEKYDWTLPHPNNNVFNSHLSGIAQKACIDEDIEIIRFVGTKRVIEYKKKYECVTSHTARRTYICLCIESGISTPVIMATTGHRQLSSFQRYIQISDKKKSEASSALEI